MYIKGTYNIYVYHVGLMVAIWSAVIDTKVVTNSYPVPRTMTAQQLHPIIDNFDVIS